jgi:TDG/mug DNA glycosylase family protein
MGGVRHDDGSQGTRGAARPTAAELEAAYGRVIRDLVADGLSVLFAGINPSLYSAATGYHFARPGNRFWPVLHRSGFTDRQLHPSEQEEILRAGLGITNVVARATARAGELSADELREGGRALAATVARVRPRWLAVVGVTAYRTAFGQPEAAVGSQNGTLGGAWLWVLPNPSGLNAHWGIDALTAEFARLRRAAGLPGNADPHR